MKNKCILVRHMKTFQNCTSSVSRSCTMGVHTATIENGVSSAFRNMCSRFTNRNLGI